MAYTCEDPSRTLGTEDTLEVARSLHDETSSAKGKVGTEASRFQELSPRRGEPRSTRAAYESTQTSCVSLCTFCAMVGTGFALNRSN